MFLNSTISILGLYNYDNSIFDNMVIPDDMESELIIKNILIDCAELELLYHEPDTLKELIGIWSNTELPTWNRIRVAEMAEYNPIENYNRNQSDNRTTQHSGSDTTTNNGTTTTEVESESEGSDTNLHQYASFDSNTLADQTKDIRNASQNNSGTSSSRNTDTNILSHGEKISDTFTSNIHGNIGVTTSQQMLESELELAPKINTIKHIVKSFKMRFCLLVY